MQTDDFIRLFAKSIQSRFRKHKELIALKIIITESQIREIESMYQIEGYSKSQAIYNDVLRDILEVLDIDYEVSLRSGLRIIRESND